MSTPVVLITGALSGIGWATAIAFTKLGHRVMISGRQRTSGDALVGKLEALGGEAAFCSADVRHEGDVERLLSETVSRFGRLDIAVNTAGTEGRAAALIEQTPESYAAMFDTNVLGTLLCMKHELKVMQGQGSGNIVNISSTMGERGAANMALYVGSKHAVEGLTKAAALEAAAYGVRVNAVAPGPTATPMLERLSGSRERLEAFAAAVPLKRVGTPEEIAEAIVFVASDRASYMTGQIIRINGGKTAS